MLARVGPTWYTTHRNLEEIEMGDMPSIYKTRKTLLLNNDVIVALDRLAARDGTSRNAVANYLLSSALEKTIEQFSDEDKARVKRMEIENAIARERK